MKQTILDYFEQTVCRFPEHIAVGDEHGELTYRQLRDGARAAATAIARRGFCRRPIALLLKRDTMMPMAMLSVLYSGNFYVVLDYESPSQRIEKILDTLRPALLVYEPDCRDMAQSFAHRVEVMDYTLALSSPAADARLEQIRRSATASDPAYALFTSGSTGVPKGAVLTHQNVVSYMGWFTRCFSIDQDTVFGSQTSLYFSMSVSDLYGALFTGGSYRMIPKTYFAFPGKLIPFMERHGINTIYWVPSALGVAAKFDLFKYCLPKSLKTVLFAGEVMPVKYLNYWRRYLPDLLYANLFGPTETTDICAYYVVDREFEESQSLPIGIACDNCRLMVIGDDGAPAQDGQPGELYVGGPFVASGYYRNPEKTGEAFVQNPLHSDYPETVYRTGDLVRRNALGELEYIGRKDFQIKHLGYRIEPSEVETAMNTVEGVNLTVCVHDSRQDRLLLGYESGQDLTPALSAAAEALLPHYMHPSAFFRFDAFPKNANGKIDRNAILHEILTNYGG